MAAKTVEFSRVQGIADFIKESLIPDQVAWMRSVDYRSDPRSFTLLPKTTKESGTVVIDLIKWADTIPTNETTFLYGDSGYLYSRSSSAAYTNLHQAPGSHGNGLEYYQGDDYLYYTTDTVIGRYGPLGSASPQFTDNFLAAAGGVPTNTFSLSLASASSQYLDRADTGTLSVTGNLCLEAFFKATTLPTTGNTMTLVSKWDESTNHRSYKMDILGVSGFFGDGSDGSHTISADTTDAPIDSACSGISGSFSLTATNVSFTAGQIILIHQTRGSMAGTNQLTKIQAYTAGTITTTDALNFDYLSDAGNNCAQVLVVKQYTNVTVDLGKTWTAKAWNGTVGGILYFLANGTFTYNGTVEGSGLFNNSTSSGVGFVSGQGGVNGSTQHIGYQGEGTDGPHGNTAGSGSNLANGNGGGGGGADANTGNGGGGGGGNGTAGTTGGGAGGAGGSTSGTTDLTTLTFGGAGGGGGNSGGTFSGGNGGNGGGIIIISAATVTAGASGIIRADGKFADDSDGSNSSGGGGGAGGSILINTQVGTLGTNQITANGGAGGNGTGSGFSGGVGGDGRIHLNYLTSYTGTTTPTVDATLDSGLVTTPSYVGRLGISNNGTAFEYLSKVIGIMTGAWYRLSISWKASTSTATFYLSAVNLGVTVGTKTSIDDNASRFYIGADKGASAVGDFFNGLIDDVRVWDVTRSDSDIASFNVAQLAGTEGGLNAYYKLNNALTDSTANSNDLTNENAATFTIDVPFSGSTTRLDIDQTASTTGHVYTTPTSIVESAGNEVAFTPTKDPQKSIAFNVQSKGTGDVTATIHNQQNRVIASATISAANMGTGIVEWIFSSVWRPLLGNQYHAHLTSTVADTTIQTGTDGSMATPTYTTYFQFLVNDVDFHPILLMLNFLAIGNERYLATWDGASYQPNQILLPPGWRIRTLAYWNEYLAIGVWKGQNIYDYDEGRIYFWDGISYTFNFYLDVPEGGINAMLGTKGTLDFIAGYQGDLMRYTYGTQAQKMKRMPKITQDKYIEVFPGALTMWQTLLRIGLAGNSDSTEVEKGAYSFGSTNNKYVESLSYDFPISTGSRTSTVKIGMVHPTGRKLLLGWQDNVSYGVDVVDVAGNVPFASGTIEFLIQDDSAQGQSMVWKDARALMVRADFLPLNAGESVDVKIKLNRATNWTDLTGGPDTTAGDALAFFSIASGINREYQLAVDLFTTTTTSPTVLAASIREDDLAEEDTFADSIGP